MIETWGKNRRSLQGKKSKLELVSEIGKRYNTKVLNIHSLPNKELGKLLNDPVTKINRVTSRRKKDYIEQINKAFPNIHNLEKVSVDGLNNLVEAVYAKQN